MSPEPDQPPVPGSASERTPGRVRRRREPSSRPVYQQVTLTEAERDQLRALAAALGVSVPRLLVESAFGRRETSTERKKLIVDLFEARRVLGTIANNVNQLARQANISGDLASEERLRQTLNEVDTVVAELRALTGAQR